MPTAASRPSTFVVANFPFSNKNWTSGLDPANDLYGRFEYGIPPAKNGDYAFLLHILASLKSTGKGAVIHPHGVLFRGGAEAVIRKRIVRQGYIKGIIGLPANLFYGTGIPACILVLDKEGAAGRKGIFMVDASKGFIKDGNKNRLRAQDIHKIVDTFTRQLETPKYSRMVPLAEIEANDFNLNLPRYIDSTEPEDLQDIEAHLKGGIPNRDIDGLAAYWQVFPNVRRELFADADRPGYSQPKVEASQVKAAIFGHAEFTAFNQQVTQLFAAWKAANTPLLTGIKQGDRPKVLIETLSESLLETFRTDDIASLIDPYGVYQHLMDYWAETMQDDAWMIVSDGWKAIQDGKPNTDLIPPALIVARYFAAEQAAIEQLEAERDAISREMEEMDEEHGGEDGLLAEGKTDKGKLSQERQGSAESHQGRQGRQRRTQDAGSLCGPDRQGGHGQQEGEGRAKGAGCKGRRQIQATERGRDQDAGGGRQMAGRTGRQRAGRTGSRQPSTDRAHQATGRTLRHAAAQAGR